MSEHATPASITQGVGHLDRHIHYHTTIETAHATFNKQIAPNGDMLSVVIIRFLSTMTKDKHFTLNQTPMVLNSDPVVDDNHGDGFAGIDLNASQW